MNTVIDNIKFGETAIVLYPSNSYVRELLLNSALKYSRSNNVPILIDDNLDSLALVQRNLRVLGIDEDFRDVYVVKTGGKYNVGNVVARVPFHPDPRVYIQLYAEKTSSLKIDGYLNISLGIEDLFSSLTSPHEMYVLILSIQRFLGNTRRKAIYIINEDSLRTVPKEIKFELERLASTVIRASQDLEKVRITILKSTNIELIGKEFKFSMEGLLW
ncbi:DUF257 family protein [Pyrococcus abyssi]|uniref:KaiC-like domain-containing protein n=1 Tax=Pyrococcus abyssi (strain GE5 / Orsay) TaxID=272844 RepID=Q9UZP9_PYRAB|nr:DUF257 family protein [Pyrococcus abyssi]CAB50007.1 Hypothetical protein PAB1639 [Pyrococcus abyssi GE5]CCE70509.1 TPA: hypothetical protein PAB1639 [Pyrococcus abyssi GE5]